MKIRLVGAELKVAFQNFANAPKNVFCTEGNKQSRNFSSDTRAGKVAEKLADAMENISVRFSIPSVYDQSVYRFPLTPMCTNAYICFSNLRASFRLRVRLPRLSSHAQNITASLNGLRRSSSIVATSLFS